MFYLITIFILAGYLKRRIYGWIVEKSIRYQVCISTKLMGIGLLLDFRPPIADREKYFEVRIDLLFICFWLTWYKSKK